MVVLGSSTMSASDISGDRTGAWHACGFKVSCRPRPRRPDKSDQVQAGA